MSSLVWADLLTADYTTGTSDTDVFKASTPESPSNLSASSQINGIQFTWSMPSTTDANSIVELWEYTSSTPFASATKIWEGAATGKFVSKNDTTQRYYWVRLRDSSFHVSAEHPTGAGVPAKAAALSSSPLAASASPGSLSKIANPAGPNPQTITTASTTTTPSGGTPGYTYAWTWASGGSGITITSPTAASTTFSGTNALDGTQNSGIARCTVTDSLTATATADVSVTLTWPSIA